MNFSFLSRRFGWIISSLLLCVISVYIIRAWYATPRSSLKKRVVSLEPAVKKTKDANPQNSPESFEERYADKDRIVLEDNSSLSLNDDWSFTRSVYMKVKILKESAKDLGEIPVYYTEGRDKIVELKAYTITPDGKRYRYTKAQDFKVYPDYPMYSDLKVRILSMPEVNIGSIIEIKKTIKSKGKTIPRSFWTEDFLEFSSPTKEANISYTFPKDFNIRYKPFHLGKDRQPEIISGEKTLTYRWHIQNAYFEPNEEDLTPPPKDVINAIEFSSFQSWNDFARWFYKVTEERAVVNPEIRAIARKIFDNQKTLKDKVRVCMEYIQDNFRYVSMSLGENDLRPHPTDEVFRNKYGDCKDLALLAKVLLSLGGIKADLALFNDRFSITDPVFDLPLPSLFDHVVLLVKNPQGDDFYADPLLKGYDINEYPYLYQRAYTFIISEDKGTFGRFPEFDSNRDSKMERQEAYINPNGFDVLQRDITWNLDDSITMREAFKTFTKEKLDLFKQTFFAKLAPDGKVLDYKVKGLSRRYGILTTSVKIEEKGRFPVVSDMIIINFDGGGRSGVFTEEKRTHPIFFPRNSIDKRTIIYHIPKNFRVEYLPPNLNLDNGFYHHLRTFEVKDGTIILSDEKCYREVEIPVEGYPKIKKFYNELPKKTRQVIILRKKKSLWEEIKEMTRRWRR